MAVAALSKRESEALGEFSTRIRAALRPNLRELRLFGSKARGIESNAPTRPITSS
jgi:hypothetical protein